MDQKPPNSPVLESTRPETVRDSWRTQWLIESDEHQDEKESGVMDLSYIFSPLDTYTFLTLTGSDEAMDFDNFTTTLPTRFV